MSRDVEKFKNKDSWPSWPMLPVKRGPDRQCAVLFDEKAFVVYLVNIFDPNLDLTKAEKIEYTNAEEVYKDGWRVD